MDKVLNDSDMLYLDFLYGKQIKQASYERDIQGNEYFRLIFPDETVFVVFKDERDGKIALWKSSEVKQEEKDENNQLGEPTLMKVWSTEYPE